MQEILVYSAIQFTIQFFLYKLICDIYISFMIWLYKGLYSFDITTKDNLIKYLSIFYTITLVATNFVISFFVRIFTSSGKMVGMSNLFASCVLGAIMLYDVRRFKLACKGKYH